MQIERISVGIDELLIDPNNPRYFDLLDHAVVNANQYAEGQVQIEATAKLVDSQDVGDLRRSILANGFIQFEHIVVKIYEHGEDKYLVIEGNRRVAAMQGIRRDFLRGVLPPQYDAVANDIENIEVMLFEGTSSEEKIIQGIRHVAGPREWKSYQQAVLVENLRDAGEMTFDQIRNSLGLKPIVVKRVYNTLKAFKQMRSDDEYGELAEPELFSLFLEMLTRPTTRNWLGWSDTELVFSNSANRKRMYQMIVTDPSSDEDSAPLISNPPDMRTFGRILGHEHREKVLDKLVERDITVDQAWAALEPGVTPWQESVESVIEALERLPADELQSLSSEREQQLNRLSDVIGRKLQQAVKLRES